MAIKLPFSTKMGIVITLSLILIISGFAIWNKNKNPQPLTPEPGRVRGTQNQPPSTFPSEIPLFEPATIRSSTQSQERVHIALETEKGLEEVLNFYQKEMKQIGWEGLETFKPKGGEAWSFTKGARRLELIAVRNETEEKTLIFLKTDLP